MVSFGLRLAVAVVAAVTLCAALPSRGPGPKKCFGARPVANFSITQFAGAWVPVWSYNRGRTPPCRVLNLQQINATAVLFQLFAPNKTNISKFLNGTVSVKFSGNAIFTSMLNMKGSSSRHKHWHMPMVLSTNYTDYAAVMHCGGRLRPKSAMLLSRTGVLADDVANRLKNSMTRYGIRPKWFLRQRCFAANTTRCRRTTVAPAAP